MNFERVNVNVFVLSLSGFAGLVTLIIKFGKYLVCKPGLRPDLIKQW